MPRRLIPFGVAAGLLERDLSPRRPLLILSANDVEHALLSLAAMYIGIPFSAISPAYSLVSSDYGKLKHILALLDPQVVFAADGRNSVRQLLPAPQILRLLPHAAP
jgi:feruloyl-CoA synthase